MSDSAASRAAFRSSGLVLLETYLPPAQCESLRAAIDSYRRANTLPVIHRQERGRSLHYSVIDGHAIRQSCQPLVDLYLRTLDAVKETTGLPLVPMSNGTANLNVNITPPGGEYRWHYDRNAVTAILYLNAVAGGEIELYPNYRIHLGRWSATRWQRHLDRFLRLQAVRRPFARCTVISPCQGLLVIMRGDRTLHSVRRVEGNEDRINVVMSFDLPQEGGAPLRDLDGYLYSTDSVSSTDPNYEK